MKKTRKTMIAGLLIGLLSGPQWGYGAASGNYTDILPVGAAGNTTVISNGSGWSLTTLPPTTTFGDSLSRLSNTVYQSTSAVTWSGHAAGSVSTYTAIVGQGYVGSTTFPASWVATGRSIRVTADGKYTTSTGTWTWDLYLGTTAVVTTGALTLVGSQNASYFKISALMTIGTTGTSGTVSSGYDIWVGSASTPATMVSFSTATAAAGATVDLTSQLTVNPRFTWGSPTPNNSITFNNVIVEFLN